MQPIPGSVEELTGIVPRSAEVTIAAVPAAEPQAASLSPPPASQPHWRPPAATTAKIMSSTARFSVLAISSLCLASLGHSLVNEGTAGGGAIASISKPIESSSELAALVGWRV